MAKLESANQVDLDAQIGHLREELKKEGCSVREKGQLQFLRFQQSVDGPEGFYLRFDASLQAPGETKLAVIVSPYEMLRFAHQILRELDPSNQ